MATLQEAKAVFNRVAWRYDLANHLLSGGVDYFWRWKLAQVTWQTSPQKILDVACGTGDQLFALFKKTPQVYGVDLTFSMLQRARQKAQKQNIKAPWIAGDGVRLPFRDATFDALTISFGLRNMPSLSAFLKEAKRVLQPGGVLSILEFSRPIKFSKLYTFYLTRILPALGGWLTHSPASYRYLAQTIQAFPPQDRLKVLLSEAGFEKVHYLNLTQGVAAIHQGWKR